MLMPATFVEKLLALKASKDKVFAGEIVRVSPDKVLSVGATTALVIGLFRELGVNRVWSPERIVMILDHGDARSNDLRCKCTQNC